MTLLPPEQFVVIVLFPSITYVFKLIAGLYSMSRHDQEGGGIKMIGSLLASSVLSSPKKGSVLLILLTCAMCVGKSKTLKIESG